MLATREKGPWYQRIGTIQNLTTYNFVSIIPKPLPGLEDPDIL